MEAKVENLKNSKVKLTITVSPKEMVRYFSEVYIKLAPTVKLDGFRPGKAPKKLIEETIGITRLMSEALDTAVQESYYKALIDNKLTPVAQPNVVINKYPNYGDTEADIKNEFEFTAELDVLPPVTLGDYSKLKVDKGEKEKPKAEDVEKILDHLQKQKANFQPVERAAKMGDFVELSFEGTFKGVRIDAMCSKNHPIVLGEGKLIPGFEEEVVGMKKGEEKTFKIKFPKDYHSKEYAGKEAEFKVSVNELKEVTFPKVDEEFAKNFGHETVPELKKAIEKNLDRELEERYQQELETKIIEKMLPLLKAEIPTSLIDQEIDRMIHDYSHQLEHQGLNFEKYLESIKKTREEIRKDMAPQAEKNVKVGLLLGKIIEGQKIDSKDEQAGHKAMEHLIKTLTK